MNYMSLLREHCKRLIHRKTSPRKAEELRKLLIRRKFLEDVHNSKGKILLNFFKIHKKKTHHIRRYAIHRFIIDELKIPLSSYHVSFIYAHLEDMGADYWKNKETIYYTNVSIRKKVHLPEPDFELPTHKEEIDEQPPLNDDSNMDDNN